MLLELVVNFDLFDLLFYVIAAAVVLLFIALVPGDVWTYAFPLLCAILVFNGVVTYLIWYLTSYKAGWYDLSYWSVFGIGVVVIIVYFLIYYLIEVYKEKKDNK